MKQNDLHRQIAKATGESIAHIRRMGFSLLHLQDNPAERDANLDPAADIGSREIYARMLAADRDIPVLRLVDETS